LVASRPAESERVKHGCRWSRTGRGRRLRTAARVKGWAIPSPDPVIRSTSPAGRTTGSSSTTAGRLGIGHEMMPRQAQNPGRQPTDELCCRSKPWAAGRGEHAEASATAPDSAARGAHQVDVRCPRRCGAVVRYVPAAVSRRPKAEKLRLRTSSTPTEPRQSSEGDMLTDRGRPRRRSIRPSREDGEPNSASGNKYTLRTSSTSCRPYTQDGPDLETRSASCPAWGR